MNQPSYAPGGRSYSARRVRNFGRFEEGAVVQMDSADTHAIAPLAADIVALLRVGKALDADDICARLVDFACADIHNTLHDLVDAGILQASNETTHEHDT